MSSTVNVSDLAAPDELPDLVFLCEVSSFEFSSHLFLERFNVRRVAEKASRKTEAPA
jgi:hypothetical protein